MQLVTYIHGEYKHLRVELVSRNHTTFSSFIFGWEEKGLVNTLYKFCSINPHFMGFYVWLLIDVKGQKRFVDR